MYPAATQILVRRYSKYVTDGIELHPEFRPIVSHNGTNKPQVRSNARSIVLSDQHSYNDVVAVQTNPRSKRSASFACVLPCRLASLGFGSRYALTMTSASSWRGGRGAATLVAASRSRLARRISSCSSPVLVSCAFG